jgi:gamma-glutamyltranspeptidase/glutathione hydrolase
MKQLIYALVLMIFGFAPSCAHAPVMDKEGFEPETSTGLRDVELVRGDRQMVSSADPSASRAGMEILAAGGSATDALIAMSMVLTLTEPQSSGIGGGGFLLHYDPSGKTIKSYDGRELSPSGATPTQFLGPDGRPLEFWDAVVGGVSVGVPGLLRMLEMAHQKHGKLPWARLFDPAIRLSEGGFYPSPRLHKLLNNSERLRSSPTTRAYFYDEKGEPLSPIRLKKNPELAKVFQAVAKGGADAFYKGPIAQRLVQAARTAFRRPSSMTLEDLAGYRAVDRSPLCAPYRSWNICGMGPPTSGGVAIHQILGVMSRFEPSGWTPGSSALTHLFAEASRLAYADRARYLADSDVIDVPVRGLIDPDYLAGRAKLISMDKTMGIAKAGQPKSGAHYAPDRSWEFPSTTHLVAVDMRGNVANMTASIEQGFGAHILVDGYLLNNELTDFSFEPERDGVPVANACAPNKRPRSSMSPTLVFDDAGAFFMAIGSPGGSRIIEYVAKTLIYVLDLKLDVQSAIAAPHIVNRNGVTELELDPEHVGKTGRLAKALRELGHEVVIRQQNSGLHGVVKTPYGLQGGADPRREGIAIGQ